MSRKQPNTRSGDRRRDRAARRARVAKPLEGNRIRVRGKRLDQVDVEKLTLAYWLLAKELVSNQTELSDAAVPSPRTRTAMTLMARSSARERSGLGRGRACRRRRSGRPHRLGYAPSRATSGLARGSLSG